MARDVILNGEVMVRVKGAPLGPLRDPQNANANKLYELGLAEKETRVRLNFKTKDINIDDYGPDVPVEVMYQLTDAHISMTLVHFDNDVLQRCVACAMGGSVISNEDLINASVPINQGTLVSMGTLYGNNVPLQSAGNQYIELSLSSPVLKYPWRFPSTYILNVAEFPLGTKRMLVHLEWRAIPYQYIPTFGTTIGEVFSSGAILFDRHAEEDP